MKKIILLLILLLPLNVFAPNKDAKHLKFISESLFIQTNLEILQDKTIKTREKVFKLVQPIIEIYLERKGYKQHFHPNLQDSLSYGLSCIFVSESSNKLGRPAMSSLWLTHNNPFGLTSSKGTRLMSWEMINGKRVNMYRTFKQFTSFEESIDSLIKDYLMKRNFNNARNSESIKDFLYNLYKGNYMTNKYWPKFAYNQIYLKNI
jgi:hypothetical protein